jgi:hypothetical protein
MPMATINQGVTDFVRDGPAGRCVGRVSDELLEGRSHAAMLARVQARELFRPAPDHVQPHPLHVTDTDHDRPLLAVEEAADSVEIVVELERGRGRVQARPPDHVVELGLHAGGNGNQHGRLVLGHPERVEADERGRSIAVPRHATRTALRTVLHHGSLQRRDGTGPPERPERRVR